jgi:hypothetical protein
LARSGASHRQAVDLFRTHWKPVGVGIGLALERSFVESVANVGETETANGTSGDGISGGGENSVNYLICLSNIDEFRCSLDLIEVEWNLPRDGTIESGLKECGPAVLEFVRASFITLAYSSNPGIDALRKITI